MPAVDFDERKIDAIFSEIDQCHRPGGAVGISIGGTPVYRKGFGLASAELPIVLSPATRMRIYSVTKHFTALAYMLLCEDGKAAIDDPIERYLPELHRVTHSVTMRQLMGHIGGLRDAHDIHWQFGGTGQKVSSVDLLSFYRDIDDVNFVPGAAWCYNNGGYLLLSTAIERITGKSLENVLQERIFEPVGMHDTLLRRIDTDFVPNSATMHTATGDGQYEKSYLGAASAGEGGIVSTVNDMLRWLAHMDRPVVGSTATWEVIKSSQVLSNGTSTGYGLGLITGGYRGVETVHHAGGGLGSNSQMLKVPAAGLDIAIMLNRDDMMSVSLANRILDACLPGLTPASAKFLPLPAGVFRSPTTGRVIELHTSSLPSSKGPQQFACIDGMDMAVQPDDCGVLRPLEGVGFAKRTITLVGDPENPAAIRYNDFGNLEELVRESQADEADVRPIVGHYRSAIPGTEATISAGDSRPRLTTVGRFGSAVYALECIGHHIWRAKSRTAAFLGGVLSFDDTSQGFRFSSNRTWALPFKRRT